MLPSFHAMTKAPLQKLLDQQAKLAKKIEFLQQSEQKFIDFAGQVRKAAADSGLDLAEVLKHLQPEKKARARRQASATPTTPPSQDRSGMKPEVGVTYKHSSWPEPWTASGKRAPKHVIATIQDGKTWAQLRQK